VSPEQLVAVLVAVTGVIGAIGVLIGQIRSLRQEINGRLSDLVDATRVAALKEGELLGRDHSRVKSRRPKAAPAATLLDGVD
jgi:hypothetical protein